LAEFKSFCQLNKDGDKAATVALIEQSVDPTFFRPAVFQQVKGQTSLTKTELDEVEKWVNARIDEGDAGLKDCYEKVEKAAKKLAESRSRDAYFKPKPYQKFIAAKLVQAITSNAQSHAMTLGAGQGKTLIILLIMETLRRDYDMKKFLILTCDDVLRDQFNQILEAH